MKRVALVSLLTSIALWPSQARATIDWCRLIPFLPSSDVRFEQTAAGIDALGCENRPQDSAHSRIWFCADREPHDTYIALFHLTEGYGSEPNLLIVTSGSFGNLSPLRACAGRGYRVEGTVGAFEGASIAVRDRPAIIRNYLPQTVYHMRLAGWGSIVAFYPDSYSGQSLVATAERIIYDIQRPLYPTTSVEIAGLNLIDSSAAQIVQALQHRGASLIRQGDPEDFTGDTELSPPVGLDGVSRVVVSRVGQHVVDVRYTLAANNEYMTYVGLLDARYGRSTARAGIESDRRQCRDRYWYSGNVVIAGNFCPDSGYSLMFLNRVAYQQLEQYRAYLRRPRQPSQPNIDPDNL